MIPWSNKLAWFGVFEVSLVQSVLRTWAQCPIWTTSTTRFSPQLWISVVQHVLSQLKRAMLSFPLAFNSSNSLEYSNHCLKYSLFRPERVCALHRKTRTATFVGSYKTRNHLKTPETTWNHLKLPETTWKQQ